jgi:hypothetical protein
MAKFTVCLLFVKSRDFERSAIYPPLAGRADRITSPVRLVP